MAWWECSWGTSLFTTALYRETSRAAARLARARIDVPYFIFAVVKVKILMNESEVLLSITGRKRESVLFAELLKNEYRTKV